MNVILLSSIVVPPDRQRRAHDEAKHQELCGSIATRGLLHPPVVRTLDGRAVLVAGERRLRACREIDALGGRIVYGGEACMLGYLPVNEIGDLSPLDAKEVELEENLQREDLTWQERAAAESELLELRRAQALAAGLAPPRVAEVAMELRGAATRGHEQSIARNVILANNLDRPEVKQAKTASEAFKALKRAEEIERNQAVAARIGPELLASKHRLMNWDSVEWMRQQPAAEYDVILTDPPYGMGADEFGDSGGQTGAGHFYDDSEEAFFELLENTIPELSRLAKPDAHLYLFCDIDKFQWLKEAFAEAGWRVFRTPLIWFKPSAFRAPWPEQGPQRKYECILYAVRGDLKCTSLAGDVITCPPDSNLGHNAQKPVALYLELLRRSARPGFRILDPFCGTGPIFPAAHSLNCIATGVEKDAAAFGIAATRLSALKGGA